VSRPLIPESILPEFSILPEAVKFNILGHTTDIGPWTLKPFGTLVAIGVFAGIIITGRLGQARGMPKIATSKFQYWVLVCAFVFGHVLDALMYNPWRVRADPLTLLRLWDGLSSFGGFAGALIGVFVFKWWFSVKNVLPFVDIMAAAFPVGWTFGRMGCAVVHDHPGIRSDMWFAVAFKDGGRLDLGMLEMVFAAIVAVVCLTLARKPRPPGFFLGLTMLVYAPVRYCLDFLRAGIGQVHGADPRYLYLTPAQWGSIAMVAAGFAFLWRAASSNEVGNDPFRTAVLEADPALLGEDPAPSAESSRSSRSSEDPPS